MFLLCFFFFKQKTAYEMRISDWSSDVCSSDLNAAGLAETARLVEADGARASLHRLDLSDIPATEAWFRAHGDVDILHNNAGVVSGLPQFPDVDAARVRWIIDVNITSPVPATPRRKSVVLGKSVARPLELGGRAYH